MYQPQVQERGLLGLLIRWCRRSDGIWSEGIWSKEIGVVIFFCCCWSGGIDGIVVNVDARLIASLDVLVGGGV